MRYADFLVTKSLSLFENPLTTDSLAAEGSSAECFDKPFPRQLRVCPQSWRFRLCNCLRFYRLPCEKTERQGAKIGRPAFALFIIQ